MLIFSDCILKVNFNQLRVLLMCCFKEMSVSHTGDVILCTGKNCIYDPDGDCI